MKKILIRVIKRKELKKAAQIFKDSFNRAYNEKWTNGNALLYLDHFYKLQKDLFMVALVDDEIVGGVMSFIPKWSKESVVDTEIFVKEGFRGRGIGKELLKSQIKKAKKVYGVKNIYFTAYKRRTKQKNTLFLGIRKWG